MADTKISALTEVTTPATTDVVPLVNAASTKKAQLINLTKHVPKGAPRVIRRHNEIVFVGDSLTDAGYCDWMNYHLGGVLDAREAGVGGETTTQMLARWPTDVTPQDSGWVSVMGGTNDLDAGVTSTTIINNLAAMADLADAEGRGFISWTIPPSILNNRATAAVKARHGAVNRWIRRMGRERANFWVIDPYPLMANRATGGIAAALTTDALHFTTEGTRLLGWVGAQRMMPHFTDAGLLWSGSPLVPQADDPNDLLSGAGQFVSVTANIPDNGWGLSGGAGVTGTIVNRTDFLRTDANAQKWYQMVLAGATVTLFRATNTLTAGTSYRYAIEIEGENLAGITNIQAFLAQSGGSNIASSRGAGSFTAVGSGGGGTTLQRCVITGVGACTITGTGNFSLTITNTGTGTVRVARACVYAES